MRTDHLLRGIDRWPRVLFNSHGDAGVECSERAVFCGKWYAYWRLVVLELRAIGALTIVPSRTSLGSGLCDRDGLLEAARRSSPSRSRTIDGGRRA